ncbi:Rgr1p [Nakaseomyces bracarensis]|uniref:Rgr1p n=1 Tax=Nakaseomyces bracarensis TaxID=273131 RepID=UPI00387185C5
MNGASVKSQIQNQNQNQNHTPNEPIMEGKKEEMVEPKKVGKTIGLKSPVTSVEELKHDTTAAPPIPHVEINQIPLSMIIRNLTVYTIKEISQYMKTTVHTNGTDTSTTRKMRFLNLLIFIRNQFLKLYVLVKWCRTIKENNFDIMIDLLNWFRGTNMVVNNCIWALKATLESTANAKLPNVDLVTALEVLSLGRPNLPTHEFKLSGENHEYETVAGQMKVPTKLVLQRLRNLNIIVMIKIASMVVPKQFNNYDIRDGRVYITVPGEFEIQLSTIDRHSPLFFVDFKFLFGNSVFPLNKPRLEKLTNEILLKSKKPLFSLHKFLHKYVLTLQLYLVHTELLSLENEGKFSGGNLVHNYNVKKSFISVKYWLNGKLSNRTKIIIGVDGKTENLILRWDNENAKQSKHMPLIYTDIVGNIEAILDEIMFNHSRLIRADLLSRGIFQEDEDNTSVLLFQMPTTCLSTAPIQLKIDLISGVFYFKNPSSLLLEYVPQINRAETPEDLTLVLQKLKLDKIAYIIRNKFDKTGWICSKVIKLDKRISTPVNSEDSGNNLLQHDMFVRLATWPVNWYLILTIVSSNSSCIIEKRIGKIISSKGKWHIQYLDTTNVISMKLERITYSKIISLQKSTLNKIINHTLIDSLNHLNIRNKICSMEMINSTLPKHLLEDTRMVTDGKTGEVPHHISLITLELESFLEGSKALSGILENTMFLRIDYKNFEIRLYSKFKRSTMAIHCQCDDLLINFVEHEPLAFYLIEKFGNLNEIVQYLTLFRQKLMQLVVLTDVVERLHKNFASEYFRIISLKPNEVTFKYLKSSTDTKDCTINIITDDQTIKNLTVKLSEANPQHIIQPFIDNQQLDYQFIFSYLQFTSPLFSTFGQILDQSAQVEGNNVYQNGGQDVTVNLGLHNLSEYQLMYYNAVLGSKITLIIELKQVSINGKKRIQFFIHFSQDEHITTKSGAYPFIHKVRNEVFMLETRKRAEQSEEPLLSKKIIRLGSGVSCDSESIEEVLLHIHKILKGEGAEETAPELAPELVEAV